VDGRRKNRLDRFSHFSIAGRLPMIGSGEKPAMRSFCRTSECGGAVCGINQAREVKTPGSAVTLSGVRT